jgi:hypothetical protein
LNVDVMILVKTFHNPFSARKHKITSRNIPHCSPSQGKWMGGEIWWTCKKHQRKIGVRQFIHSVRCEKWTSPWEVLCSVRVIICMQAAADRRPTIAKVKMVLFSKLRNNPPCVGSSINIWKIGISSPRNVILVQHHILRARSKRRKRSVKMGHLKHRGYEDLEPNISSKGTQLRKKIGPDLDKD